MTSSPRVSIAQGVHRLMASFPDVEFVVAVAGSEGVECEKFVQSYGFHYVETPNSPLGAKALSRMAFTRTLEPDYVLMTGSDDLFCDDCMAFYLRKISEGYEEIAPLGIYYCNLPTGEVLYSFGYVPGNPWWKNHEGQPIAAGRMLSRRVLDAVGWALWPEVEATMLDRHAFTVLEDVPHSTFYFDLMLENVRIIDIKSSVNMTHFCMLGNRIAVPPLVLRSFPELCAALQAP